MSRRDFNPVVGRWTPDEDSRLRRLAEEGRNSAVIAERLKRSRSSVLGRAKTLGIEVKRAVRKTKRK
jgi:hypothetical protein